MGKNKKLSPSFHSHAGDICIICLCFVCIFMILSTRHKRKRAAKAKGWCRDRKGWKIAHKTTKR